MSDKRSPLADAVARHVQAGDSLYLYVGHSRWSAASREVVRQWWRRDPGFTLITCSLSSLGALFFRGDLVRKVITGYSGDTIPNFTPNPHFADAYRSGAVEVEHWSFLALAQRLEAAARGLPAIATRSVTGSSMADNDAFATVKSPFGEVGLLAPLAPDVAILHAPVADIDGNVAIEAPLLEGVWGALAARRGVIVTVERVVEDLRPWSHLVRIPGHRVLAVAETPLGAHPGGCFARDLPVDGYGEDYDFWIEARAATRSDDYDEWIRHWVLEPDTQAAYLERLGTERVATLRARHDAESWRADLDAHPPDLGAEPNAWEQAAVFAARHVADRCVALDATAVLAGAGVANLAAWSGVDQARAHGAPTVLTAEIGMWDYDPVPGDPLVLNHRNFWRSTMISDAHTVLGALIGGNGARTLACLGAAQVDRRGNLNTTEIPDGPFLVGSGGGNDVVSVCAEAVIVATLTPARTPEQCGYVTSPGERVRAVVTDLGMLEKLDGGELVLTAVPAGEGSREQRVAVAVAACGWKLRVADSVRELEAPSADEIAALRRFDPRGYLLRP